MTDRDVLLRRLRRANPAPSQSPLSADVVDSRPPVAWLIEGNPFMPATTTPTPNSRRAPLIAAAAVMVGLVVAVPALLMNHNTEEAAVTTLPATTPTSITLPAAPLSDDPIVPVATYSFDYLGASPQMTAVSEDEAWAALGGAIGHWQAGRWEYYTFREGVGGTVDGVTPRFRDVAVAADGVVWAAADIGVFSFDGVEWVQRFDGPVLAVEADRHGVVWIGGGTEDGRLWLAKREADSWRRVDGGGTPVRGAATIAILEDEVWLATYGYMGRIGRYDGTALIDTEITTGDGQVHQVVVTSMSVRSGVALWVVGWSQGTSTEEPVVAVFEGETWWVDPLPDALSSGPTRLDVAVTESGRTWPEAEFDFTPTTQWVLGPSHLARFEGNSWTFHPLGGRASDLDVAPDGTAMYLGWDGQGGFSVGTLSPIAEPTLIELPAHAEFQPVAGSRMVAPSTDDVWAIVGRSTIGHWIEGRWIHYGFPQNDVRIGGIAVGTDGLTWAATDAGVFSFDGTRWTRRFGDPTGVVAVDRSGTVWIGGTKTSWGDSPLWLAYSDDGAWVRVDGSGRPENSWGTIATLANGEIWIASFGWSGWIDRYDGVAVTRVGNPGSGQAFAFAEAPDGTVWAVGSDDNGGRGWVGYRDGSAWVTVDLPDELAHTGWLSEISIDRDGVVWVHAHFGPLASFDGIAWDILSDETDVVGLGVTPDGTVIGVGPDGVHILSP